MVARKKRIPSKVNPKIQISISGPNRVGGLIFDEFLPELRFPQGTRIYNEMRKNSPIIGGFLRAIEAAFRSTQYVAIPYDNSKVGLDRATFLNQCINDMERCWADVLSDILTFLPFGFSAMEMVYKQRRGHGGVVSSKHNDGRIGLRDLVLIPHESINEWIWDEEPGGDPNKLIGLRQLAINVGSYSASNTGWVDIPIKKVMLTRVRPEKNSPEGESILRQAYRSWYFMNNLEVVEAISLERTGAGVPMIKLPEGATSIGDEGGSSDEQKARDIVSQIRADEQGGIVVPHGWEFELVTSTGLRPELFDLAIKRHRSNILISVLALFLELGASRVGSFALASVGRSHFENAWEGWATAALDVFNETVVPMLFRLNGIDDYRLPKLAHAALAGQGLETTMKSITEFMKLEVFDKNDPVLKEHVMSLLGIPRGSTQVERAARAEREEEEEELEQEPEMLEPDPSMQEPPGGNGFNQENAAAAVSGEG